MIKKVIKILLLSCLLFTISCATTASKLTEVPLKSSKNKVNAILGSPEAVILSKINSNGQALEVLSYRLYQYEGAIEGLSPYYNMYALFFIDNELFKIMEVQQNARLTEAASLDIIDSINPVKKQKIEITIE